MTCCSDAATATFWVPELEQFWHLEKCSVGQLWATSSHLLKVKLMVQILNWHASNNKKARLCRLLIFCKIQELRHWLTHQDNWDPSWNPIVVWSAGTYVYNVYICISNFPNGTQHLLQLCTVKFTSNIWALNGTNNDRYVQIHVCRWLFGGFSICNFGVKSASTTLFFKPKDPGGLNSGEFKMYLKKYHHLP